MKKAKSKAKATPAKTVTSLKKSSKVSLKTKSTAKKPKMKTADSAATAQKKETQLATATPKAPAVMTRAAAQEALAQKAANSKWASLYSKAQKIPVSPYNLKSQYEPETAIQHKTLGWGYILDKKNDRLEVLFENGIKYLISNYK